ncbi:MAG: hypothetical protein M1156_02325 [Candidatus Marsarchaeota archaeon]|jgi:exosome complex component RRP4|nr:hypothetical protein [Candidatus Marsarchaeota archaeon]
MKRIIVPGDLVEDKPLHLMDTFIEENKTYATVISIYDDEKKSLVPLEGLWYPQRDEPVIGVIEEAKLNTYTVQLSAPYKGIIISKYTEGKIENGDMVEAYVKELDKTGTVVLSRPRVLHGGKIVIIRPAKVHRLLGRANTMVKQISDGTGAMIKVGMNGAVWLKGGNIDIATDAVLRIQNEAHISGLTERIGNMVKDTAPKNASEPQAPKKHEESA